MLLNARFEAMSKGQLFPRRGDHGVWTLGQMVLYGLCLYLVVPLQNTKSSWLEKPQPASLMCAKAKGSLRVGHTEPIAPASGRLDLPAQLQGLAGLAKSWGLLQQSLGLEDTREQRDFALPVMPFQRASVSPFIYTVDVQPPLHTQPTE